MDIEEQKYLTPAEVANKHELFNRNEYLRLTGQWFIPLPCHFWQLKKGMEFDIDYDGMQMISLTFRDHLNKNLFDAFVNDWESEYFNFSSIKRMRIKSFEVKND